MFTRVHSRQYSRRIQTILILEQAFEICHYDICKCLKTTNIITNKTSFCRCIISKLKCTSFKLKIGVKLIYVSTNIYYIFFYTKLYESCFEMRKMAKWNDYNTKPCGTL